MGFLFFCLLVLGVVWLISRGRKSISTNNPLVTQRIIDGLQLLIDRNETVSRAQLEELRDWAVLQSGIVPSSSGAPGASSTGSHPGANLEATHHDAHPVQPRTLTQPIDNVNLLLFLGAFLLVVSAGIFVGVNYADLTGGVKTLFLAIFALSFYGTGMVLFRLNAKYRPAAITFIGIGLIVIPLVGLAMYNLVYDQQHGAAVWFGTSLVTLVFYIYTLLTTRLTFVAYFMAAMVLSLFESTTWLAGLSVYWLSWGMAVTALLMSLFARWKPLWQEATDSLALSAQIFLPIALLLSLGLAGDYGLGQVGVTLALGSLFYVLMATSRPRVNYTDAYWAAALVLLPLGITLGLWENFDRIWLGLIVTVVAILYHVLARYGTLIQNKHERTITAVAAGCTGLAASALLAERPGSLLIGLLITVVITLDLAFMLRQIVVASIGILASLFVPYTLAWASGYNPSDSHSFIAYASLYTVLVPLLFFLRLRMTDWPNPSDGVIQTGYLVAAALALGTAAYAGVWPGIIFGLLMAVMLYGLSYLETGEWLGYVAGGALYIGLWQIARLDTAAVWAASAVMGTVAAGLALAGHSLPEGARSRTFRLVAIVGATLGAATGVYLEPIQLAPIGSLALVAILVWLEGQRLQQAKLKEVGVGIGALAVMWLWSYLGYSNLQVYTWTLGVYGAWVTSRYWRDANARDLWLAGTLAIITIPLAGQALSVDGQYYGLALIATSIGIVFAGMGLKSRLMIIWGSAALLGEVLYQMRDLLFAIPKYLISAGLGIALIGAAIVALRRRSND